MNDDITWISMDTSKKKHAVAILDPGSDEPRELVVVNEARAIRRFARKVVREASGPVRVCYEAGPCGFALKRELEKSAPGLSCQVIAPALIPVRPGDRIKTDRRDSRKLVSLFRSGELSEVRPPNEAEESIRDLTRCREHANTDLQRARHRLSKFLLRKGIVYREGTAWTEKHDRWLSRLTWDSTEDEVVFGDYRLAISQCQERLRSLVARIEEVSRREPYREAAGWLQCFRGIEIVTSMTILAELHGFERFKSPRELMAFLGLTPSERSSADRVRRGGITKTGNGHVRRILIEAAWHNHHKPAIGRKLKIRRENQPAWAIAHADRAMVRLHRRYHYLLFKGKPRNKVVTAIARELVGFIWALLSEGRQRAVQSAA